MKEILIFFLLHFGFEGTSGRLTVRNIFLLICLFILCAEADANKRVANTEKITEEPNVKDIEEIVNTIKDDKALKKAKAALQKLGFSVEEKHASGGSHANIIFSYKGKSTAAMTIMQNSKAKKTISPKLKKDVREALIDLVKRASEVDPGADRRPGK